MKTIQIKIIKIIKFQVMKKLFRIKRMKLKYKKQILMMQSKIFKKRLKN